MNQNLLKKFKNREFRNKIAIAIISILFLLGTFLPYITYMF